MKCSIALILSLALLFLLTVQSIGASSDSESYTAYSMLNDYEKEYHDAIVNLEPGALNLQLNILRILMYENLIL